MDPELERRILKLALERHVLSERQLKEIDLEIHEIAATRTKHDATDTRLSLLQSKGILTKELLASLIEELQGEQTAFVEPGRTPPENVATFVLDDSPAVRARKKAEESRGPEITEFGRYNNLEFLGQGGMASVYKAHDPTLDRSVALKFVRADTPEFARRLATEARTQAKVEHEHICKVYEVGEIDGRNYIAMQFIQGMTLKDAAKEMSLAQKIRIMMEVAEALHAAHRVGLIHRDLKPANIMVERRDDRWIPFVMDFGLARELQATGLTQAGMAVGTPSYMSPEQARGDIQHIDRRTDVYSIGATLYELLTGNPPFHGESSMGILLKVLQQDPPAPRSINPDIPPDLETVVLKCMEKDPERRYENARALADELRRFLEGEPVLAQPPSWSYRAAKKIRKNKTLTIVGGVALAAVLAFALFAAYTWWRSQRQAKIANEFGQEVQYLQERIRYVYTDDLHDVRKEEAQLRDRLKQLEARMNAEGPIAQGPGNYALGQGYLALHDYEAARSHLEAAWDREGYRLPQVAYAYGMSMASLYRDALADARQAGTLEEQESMRKQAAKQYRNPALQLIKQGQAGNQALEYVEALIAYLESRLPEAEKQADAAYAKVPWMYEALRLKGEIYAARADGYQASGESQAALDLYRQAESIFAEVIHKAPSDAQTYISMARLQWSIMRMLLYQSDASVDEAFRKGVDTCTKGLKASPDSSELYTQESMLNNLLADSIIRSANGQDPTPALQEGVRLAQTALKLDPGHNAARLSLAGMYMHMATLALENGTDPAAPAELGLKVLKEAAKIEPGNPVIQNLIGNLYHIRARYAMRRGEDPMPFMDKSLEAEESSLQLNPGNVRLHVNICLNYGQRADFESGGGRDPQPFFAKAIAHCEKAEKLNPEFADAFNATGAVYYWKAAYEIDHGRNPEATLDSAVANYQKKVDIKPSDPEGYANACEALNLKAKYRYLVGSDVAATASEALELCKKAVTLGPDMDFAQLNHGLAVRWLAEARLSASTNPDTELAEARAALQRAYAINQAYPEVYLGQAQTEWTSARWKARQNQPWEAGVTQARAYLAEAQKVNPQYADALQLLAEMSVFEAQQLLRKKQAPEKAIDAGLQAARQALTINPGAMEAQALQGVLLLLQAQGTTDAAVRKTEAAQARDLLQQSLQHNGNLQRLYAPYLQQATDLASR